MRYVLAALMLPAAAQAACPTADSLQAGGVYVSYVTRDDVSQAHMTRRDGSMIHELLDYQSFDAQYGSLLYRGMIALDLHDLKEGEVDPDSQTLYDFDGDLDAVFALGAGDTLTIPFTETYQGDTKQGSASFRKGKTVDGTLGGCSYRLTEYTQVNRTADNVETLRLTYIEDLGISAYFMFDFGDSAPTRYFVPRISDTAP